MSIWGLLTDAFGHLVAMLFPWPRTLVLLAAGTILASTALRNQLRRAR